MMTSRVVSVLVVTAILLSTAWAAPQVRPPQTPAASSPAGSQAPQTPAIGAAPAIKHVGAFGPVPGGKETAGLVQLLAPSRNRLGTSVQLTSNRPEIAAVPAGVVVALNTTDAGFKVTTSAVTAPTVVTITARIGSEIRSANLTVRPPQLSNLACSPQQVPIGTRTTCTVWLDGTAAADTFVSTSSAEYGSSMFPYIEVAAGNVKGTRELLGFNAGPQPRPVTVNASYGAVSRSTNLTIGPAYLKDISIVRTYFAQYDNDSPRWLFGVARVELHAPAPSGGLNFKIKPTPATAMVNDGAYTVAVFTIPGGKSFHEFPLAADPVATETPVTLQATTTFEGANDIRSTTFVVRPAQLYMMYASVGPVESYQYFSRIGGEYPPYSYPLTVAPGGTRVRISVSLQGAAPAGGAAVLLSYSTTPRIEGPGNVLISKYDNDEGVKVTAYPCPQVECTGWVRATYLGRTMELPLPIRRE